MDLITDPYALARAGLCHYTGDANPLDYDGAWYNPDDWQQDGYANAVRVTCMPEGPDGGRHLMVERLTVNKPKDLAPALKCCGAEEAHQSADADIQAQIEVEACLAYGHYDPNCSDYREPSSYSLVIPDDDQDPAGFARYCQIHGARVASEDEVWHLLGRLVGRDSCD